jgi:dTDP-4-amino-4,6-dideoxygalactose transaminase
MNRIEFGEVKIGKRALDNLKHCCETNWVSGGPKVKEFEKKWNDLFDYGDSVAVSSGTDAVINACLALYDFGAKRGDEIIVPALSFIATSNAVRAAGFTPVFVDVELETLNINTSKIKDVITDKTVAIIAVHTMGKMCDMSAICEIAEDYGFRVIEDAAEAHGASHQGITVGKWGDASTYSFYVAHLVCCGEGGMVSCNTKEYADIIKSTRSHGRPHNSIYFDHLRTGINSKMNDLEASIGLEAIEVFWRTFDRRHQTMTRIRNACRGFEDIAFFSEEDLGDTNCPHGFSVTCKNKGDINIIKSTLDKYDIHHKRNFGCIPTQHKAFSDMGYSLGDFPASEWIGDNGIHIGCHQYLTEENIERIKTALTEGLSLCTR